MAFRMPRGMDRYEIAWTLNPRSSAQLRDLPPSSLEAGSFHVSGRNSHERSILRVRDGPKNIER